MENTTTTPNILTDWEQEPCSRCGGSGHHSYCSQYGTTCFKCHGAGRALTARGVAAVTWLKEQRLTPASALTAGMRVRVDGYRKPLVLQDVRQSLNYNVASDGTKTYYLDLIFPQLAWSVFPSTQIEVVPSSEAERVAQVRAAIAYQNTLTKAGKPRKVNRRAA